MSLLPDARRHRLRKLARRAHSASADLIGARSRELAAHPRTGTLGLTANRFVALTAIALTGLTTPNAAIEPGTVRFEPVPNARVGAGTTFDHDNDLEGWRAVTGIESARVTGGKLDIRTNGPDPHLVGPPIRVDAAEHQFLGLRCRTDVAGVTQIYFGDIDVVDFVEGRLTTIDMRPTDDFVTYEIDLRTVPSWKGTVDELRIDPVNGVDETHAHFEIDWIAVYQAPPRLVPLLPRWDGPDRLVVGFENRGGWGIETPIEFLSDGLVVGSVSDLDHESSRRTAIDASEFPQTSWIEAVQDGRTFWRGRVVRPSPTPLIPRPAGDEDLGAGSITIAHGEGVLHASADAPDARVRLAPIASATLRGPEELTTYYEFDVAPCAELGAGVYREIVHDPRIGDVTCTLRVDGTDVEASLESCADLDVLRFEGPRMNEDRPHTHALLPGLEYLEAGETSSNPAWTGPRHAPRELPPAYRITAPMVSVEYDRVDGLSASAPSQRAWTASVAWADWGVDATGADAVPAVDFRSTEYGASFATVFLPARAFTDDCGDRFAAEPQRVASGDRMTLRTSFAIERGTIEDVFERHWLSRIPEPPPLGFVSPDERPTGAARIGAGSAAALEQILATSIRSYTGTLFDGPGRWKTHIAIQEPYADRPEMAAAVIAEAARSGRPELVTKIGLPADASIESLLGSAGDWVAQKSYAKAAEVIAAMEPDGSIDYVATPELRQRVSAMTKFHAATGDVLGVPGATNSGLIAEKALPLLEYAACSRDPIFVAAATRALARMNTFTVPRGSQTWEIHADTPDLFAAAMCARANLWGWRITGEEHYLDEAQRWLRTGLPFLYWWEPAEHRVVRAVDVADQDGEGLVLMQRDPTAFYADPDRPILPFASIPVFGTSWYAVPWFGIPVQWCGIGWANAVREIDEIRPMPEYVRIADGTFRSGANQQCDKGYLAGTLPDSWDLATNVSRQPYIVPERIVEYAYRCLGVPNIERKQYVRLEGGDWTHVASRSLLEKVEQLQGRLSISSRFFGGQDASLILGGSRVPIRSVNVDGEALTPGDGIGQYHWIDCGGGRSVLVVRWRSKTTDRIDVEIVTAP